MTGRPVNRDRGSKYDLDKSPFSRIPINKEAGHLNAEEALDSLETNVPKITDKLNETNIEDETVLDDIEDSIMVASTESDDSDIMIMSSDSDNTEHDVRGVINKHTGALNFAILGSGQGGSRVAVQGFYAKGIAKTLVVNKSKQDLDNLNYVDTSNYYENDAISGTLEFVPGKIVKTKAFPDSQKLHMALDKDGAGKNMVEGEKAAVTYKTEILEKMKTIYGDDKSVDHLFVIAASAGGTGSGSFKTLIELATSYMKLQGKTEKNVGAIVILPDTNECGETEIANTKAVMKMLNDLDSKGLVSPIIVIDNNHINAIFKKEKLSVNNKWHRINATISGVILATNKRSMTRGIQNLDPTDYKSLFTCGGYMAVGTALLTNFGSTDAISKSMVSNIKNGLLATNFDLGTAKAAGVASVAYSDFAALPGGIDMLESSFGVFQQVLSKNGVQANVFKGIYDSSANKTGLELYTIISGLMSPAYDKFKK